MLSRCCFTILMAEGRCGGWGDNRTPIRFGEFRIAIGSVYTPAIPHCAGLLVERLSM